MLKNSLKMTALAAGLLVPGVAAAAANAIVTTDLNIRTGPGASYQRYSTIPAGDRVVVQGCLTGYNWCDVSWAGNRGWVSGNYLAYTGARYTRRPISSIGISIGLPVLRFDPYDYHRRYYSGRSWYNDRYLDRREVRQERREDRQDLRQDRREERRETRQERREDRRDDRREARQERRAEQPAAVEQTPREARREQREERRALRRQNRD